ncbi:MAG: DUF2155 domain-containing protein [Deltaproteobacteria bacterium]
MARLVGAVALILGLAQPVFAQTVTLSDAAEIRALDKITGDLADIEIKIGQTMQIGRLHVKLDDCRFTAQGDAQIAYAYFEIDDPGLPDPRVFAGWMSADSPGLNPLDHPRYDIWLLRCKSAATE